MTLRRIGIFCASWALLLPFGAAAEEPLKLLTLNYKPYSYLSETKVEGINTDIVRELFRRAGKEIEITVKPWARVLREAKRGRVDAIYNPILTKERAKYLDYLDQPLIVEVIRLFRLKGSSITYTGSLDSIAGQRVGVVKSFSLGPKLDDAFASGSLYKVETSSTSNLIKILTNKRIPLIASDQVIARAMAAESGFADVIEFAGPVVQETPTYLAMPKGRSTLAFRNRLDAFLAEMRKDGTVSRILKKHGL
ncbi:MAG: transporter substrate-binding domain-containing protein [Alphaproteobacteria bacterium]|jgi:polar amino acid transport system substrate-binding protein|nr:transporter substrate-binding domain-containing protein [Alphaproteobacteria bacterium]